MEVHFTPDIEARLDQLATETGRARDEFVQERFENVPYFFSDVFDLSYEFWGDTTGAERTEYRGDVYSKSFSAWWLKGNEVVAAFTMNRPDAEREEASHLQRKQR